VTDDFLAGENSERPDVLGLIQAPPMIPQP
jgi:hypothetical protein